jgi:hypothetical protein
MGKIMVSLALLLCAAGAVLADTLYLTNGRERKGAFIGYENGEFILELTNGNQVRFKADRVERLVIDRDTSRYRGRDRDDSTFSGSGTSGRWESFDAFDVRLEDDWIRSPVRVTKGQHLRVEAGGTVMLEGRTTVNADGLRGQRDPDAPMPNENDGALIAAIGQGFNSLPFYIGRSREFVAERDGILYFSVNHSKAQNSRGAFRVIVSLDRAAEDSAGRSTVAAQRREKTITVHANQAWTDTGIDLEPNMAIEITAEGQIEFGVGRSTGPDGNRGGNLSVSSFPVPNAGVGAVIARIRYRDGRDSNSIFIGSRNQASTEQDEYGRLLIGVNDDNYRDNTGSYQVTIRW